jgi:hypothetical protein
MEVIRELSDEEWWDFRRRSKLMRKYLNWIEYQLPATFIPVGGLKPSALFYFDTSSGKTVRELPGEMPH